MKPIAELQQVASLQDSERGDSRPSFELVERLKLATPPSSKPKFAVDIDSTLYDFEVPAREAFQKLADMASTPAGRDHYLKGLYHPWTEWRSPADVCGIETWMEVISMCHSPEVVAQQTPLAGSVVTLQALANRGYELMYISTRSPEAAKATEEWLHVKGYPMGKGIEVHCRMEDKGPYLAECQYIFDDRPKTLIEFVHDFKWDVTKGERYGLSIMYDYNRALTDIPNVFLAPTWAGLNAWLVRHHLLPYPTHRPLESA